MYEWNVPLKEGEGPFYEQIYEYMISEIQSGALPPATRMPSTRALAANLGVSRSTTQTAYDQLVAEGYLEARPCRGYFIADMEWMEELRPKKTEAEEPSEPTEPGEPVAVARWDFSPRGVDLKTFPYEVWRKLSREVLRDNQEDLFNAGDSQGERELRKALAAYLHSARGVNCRPEQILVGAGNEYLLLLLVQMLGENRVIAMEDPTYRQASRVFSRAGCEVRPVSMDSAGMSAVKLQESGADIAYVMPSHQYPTGVIMPIKRRMELLSWAAQKPERYLIEDDYDSEFRYKGKPIPSLQGADTEGKVIYLGSFSRSVAPAIRISYLVLPEHFLSVYRERCRFYASTVSRVDQHILARFLQEGYFERHLNKMRKIYRGKHDALLAALAPLAEDVEIAGENAGIHLLVTSQKGHDENWMVDRAKEAGVTVYGLSRNRIGTETPKKPGTVILGYANCSIEEISLGAQALVQAWKS